MATDLAGKGWAAGLAATGATACGAEVFVAFGVAVPAGALAGAFAKALAGALAGALIGALAGALIGALAGAFVGVLAGAGFFAVTGFL
ncbi:MAG: hypothetical protein KAX47_08470, partial [Zoogloea sp.]|nr:hypothetical protein [Zoogloea sp.]